MRLRRRFYEPPHLRMGWPQRAMTDAEIREFKAAWVDAPAPIDYRAGMRYDTFHGQSRKASLLEAAANMITGHLLAVAIGFFVYPLFGATFSAQDNFSIAAVFYVASFVRSYVWRRIFNRVKE